jgi:hypothetical protein
VPGQNPLQAVPQANDRPRQQRHARLAPPHLRGVCVCVCVYGGEGRDVEQAGGVMRSGLAGRQGSGNGGGGACFCVG